MRSTTAQTLIDVHSGLKLAKSPRWIGRTLLFLDIHDRSIKSADLQGNVRTIRSLAYQPGGLGLLANGDMLVGDAWHRKIYRYARTGSREIADLCDTAGYCLSDGIVDSRGGMYVGDVGYDFLDPLVDPVANGVIIHVNANGISTVVATDLFFPNGLLVTPDNRTLIVAETLAYRLTAFEIEDDGSLHSRRVWAQFEGDIKPDGICLDREGAIWVAGTGLSAYRVKEGGEVDQQIATRRPVFASMLGGPEGKHLFMLTSDSSDPVITSRGSNATIDIAEVETPGSEFPWPSAGDSFADAIDF